MTNINQSYKVNAGTPWQVLDDSVIILSPKTKMAHELDEIGSLIWLSIEENKSLNETISKIVSSYQIDSTTAQQDTLNFISELKKQNLIELV